MTSRRNKKIKPNPSKNTPNKPKPHNSDLLCSWPADSLLGGHNNMGVFQLSILNEGGEKSVSTCYCFSKEHRSWKGEIMLGAEASTLHMICQLHLSAKQRILPWDHNNLKHLLRPYFWNCRQCFIKIHVQMKALKKIHRIISMLKVRCKLSAWLT